LVNISDVVAMVVTASTCKITWELLPEDFVLEDEPVDNVNQTSKKFLDRSVPLRFEG
jgi:hypothetical protein